MNYFIGVARNGIYFVFRYHCEVKQHADDDDGERSIDNFQGNMFVKLTGDFVSFAAIPGYRPKDEPPNDGCNGYTGYCKPDPELELIMSLRRRPSESTESGRVTTAQDNGSSKKPYYDFNRFR
jgi:hypothetical protein